MQNNLLFVIEAYQSVIKSFKNRTNVLNGMAIGWKGSAKEPTFENTPKAIGDGLGTTGFCVSASEALLLDDIFQLTINFRQAKAKLISIDIKEQYYGYCYNGSQNKWHTAILVEDSGFNIVIDITCRQFGNQFIDKDIWDFQTWEATLRSPLCRHKISENIDNPGGIVPIYISPAKVSELSSINMMDQLRGLTNIGADDRIILTDFLQKKMNELNAKLLIGNITVSDYKYIDQLNKLMMKLPFGKIDAGFAVLRFENKNAAKNWLKLFLEGKGKIPTYMVVSSTVSKSCSLQGYDENDINISYKSALSSNKTYLVIQFANSLGITSSEWLPNSTMLLPFGISMSFSSENIYNGGKLIDGNVLDGKVIKETNTIFMKFDNQSV
jgi:hypothetical protein